MTEWRILRTDCEVLNRNPAHAANSGRGMAGRGSGKIYRAGGLTIMVSHTTNALANGGHGTLLGGVNYSAGGGRRLPSRGVKFSEREMERGARSSRLNIGIKTGKLFGVYLELLLDTVLLLFWYSILRIFFCAIEG